MKQKTLSNPAKSLAYIRPRSVFKSLSDRAHRTFGFLLEANINLKTLFFAQRTIGKSVDLSERTIRKAVDDLEAVGLLSTETRNYQTLIYTINPIVFTSTWHSELYNWFRRYPPMGHSLWVGLLYSDSQDFAGGVPTTYTGNLRKTKKANTSLSYLSSLTCFNKLSYRSYEGVSYKGAHMSTELNHQLVRSIGLALNKRGSCMTNDETLNLFAFPSDVLEKVCHEMKNASGLNSPAAFFFGRCRNYTLESGRKPDWGRVNELRDSGYRVLSESEERVNNNGKESKERPQREQAKVSYNDYIQQAQATAQKAQAQSLSVSQKYQIRKWKEQREQALAANNQGWANALTQMIEDIENPRVKSIEEQIAGWVQAVTDNATLLEGSPYKPMLMKIAQSNLEHLRSQLGSNTAKDITQSNVVVAPPSQKRNPVADLKVSAYTGESDEAMLHDSGECSPDAQTSFISGSAL